ncbi:MAG: glycosyltransferase family 9 protein [Elusimicrobia bacterium]|nr:glycosyltransferase family 9 protein [Elusimicrobiota bacterium]
MGPGILIIVFKGIGDVLLTTPLVRALKKGLPDSRLYFLTRKPSRGILELNPYLDGVFYREDSPLGAIRRAGVDISMDFMRSSVSGCYSLFSGAGRRLAFSYTGGRLFYNRMQPKKEGLGYTVLDRLQFLDTLGVPADGVQPDLFFRPGNAAKAEAFLAAGGVAPGAFTVTFDITSPREHRRWAPELFARLADRLAREHGAKVVFLAGPGELDYVKTALAAAEERHLPCPGFDLLDLAALAKRAGLHVGLSSAPMHIAVSQGAPTFTIYAPQNSPANWSPPGPAHAWIQGALDSLSFDEVWARLDAHVKTLKAPGGAK